MEIPDIIGLMMMFSLCLFGVYAIIINYLDYRFIERNINVLSDNLNEYGINVIKVGYRYRLITPSRCTKYMTPSNMRDVIEDMNDCANINDYFILISDDIYDVDLFIDKISKDKEL